MTILACSIDGCERPKHTRGYCRRHYYKVWKYGDPFAGNVQYETPEESFAGRTRQVGDCLVWVGATNTVYGMITVAPNTEQYVHRYAWERAHGPIPDGMMPDHTCHNKLCVNAAHMRLVNKVQNAQNVRGPRSDNTSGHLGVSWNKARGKWMAYASFEKKMKFLGNYATAEEAAEVSREFRLKHYTHNDHDRAA
jgi:hypothetical protein